MAINTDDQNLSNNTTTTSNSVSSYPIQPNVLLPYASYTYNIKLQVTQPDNWNITRQNNTYDPQMWTTILKSGGVGPIKASRPAVGTTPAGTKTYFNRDLYIDDLEFTTFIGLTQHTRGTNISSISFKIIEPNGMDFLEELFDFCHDEDGLNEYNYTQLPYMLVISFLGYDDTGALSTAGLATKYIPINLLNMEIKLSATGAIYDCTAIPINEMAFSESCGRINKNISLVGATVNDYLQQLAQTMNNEQQDLVQKGIYQYPDTYNINVLAQSSVDQNLSLMDIGSSQIAYTTDIAKKDSPAGTPPSPDGKTINVQALAQNFLSYQFLDNAQPNTNVINIGKSNVQFSSGSSIQDCINNIVISSKYITDQVAQFRKNLAALQETASNTVSTSSQNEDLQQKISALNIPFQWFKIICDDISYGKYDSIRNTYQKTITYTVKPYIVDNSRSPIAPSAIPLVRVLKQYNYIFTGKNTEVINFDINFKNAFINYSQSNTNTKRLSSGASTPSINQNAKTNSSTPVTPVTATPVSTILSDSKSVVGSPYSNQQIFGTGVTTEDRALSSDVASTLYSKEDLLILSLQIMGDPDYIKQDEIFLQPLATLTPYVVATSGQPGGILFDAGEIYFNVNFLIPKDYNLNSGLMDVNSSNNNTTNPSSTSNVQYKRNVFSGLYAVITVNNSFNGGRFEQTLEARRYDDSQAYTTQPNTVTSG